MLDHSFYMDLILKEAWKNQLLTYPNPAVGALILDSKGAILSIGAHKKAGEPHAEVLAIKEAYKKITKDELIEELSSSELHEYLRKNHNNIFEGMSIYSTLEPCAHVGKTPSCASLISSLKFKRAIFGSFDKSCIAKGGGEILKEGGVESLRVESKGCEELLEPFIKWNQGSFVLYKLAQRLNGSIDGGYISSQDSLEYVHNIRDKVDLLVIGGDTVRVDRPTLDARLVGGRAPDVMIYSSRDDFDRDIPLFGVKNRDVFISNNRDDIKRYRFVMLEGGEGVFSSFCDLIDWNLFFVSPNIKGGKSINIDINLCNIWVDSIGKESIIWSKKEEK